MRELAPLNSRCYFESFLSWNRAKNEAWKELAGEFNSHGKVFRSIDALKNKWKNIKKGIRADSAAEKRYIGDTGGGPALPKSKEVSPEDAQLRAILAVSATGMDNQFDEDFQHVTCMSLGT